MQCYIAIDNWKLMVFIRQFFRAEGGNLRVVHVRAPKNRDNAAFTL